MDEENTVKETLKTWFGSRDKGGVLSEILYSYEYRQHQFDMAIAVAEAIGNREHLIVEAGTGVGKTLAYLTPIIASGEKAIISTATKTLQEQLVKKDIPVVLKLPGINLDPEIDICVLKGRSSYVCKKKFAHFEKNVMFGRLEQIIGIEISSKAFYSLMEILRRWLKTTTNGDLSEFTLELSKNGEEELQKISFIEEKLAYLLGSSSEHCRGALCSFFNSCFVNTVRRKAQKARLVVVNHHLLCTDLAGKISQSFEIIPSGDVLVVDEAHHLPDVVTQVFTVSYHSSELDRLTEEVSMALENEKKNYDEIERKIQDYHHTLTSLFFALTGESTDSHNHRVSFKKMFRKEEDWLNIKNILEAMVNCYQHIILLFNETDENHATAISMARKSWDALKVIKDNPLEGFPWLELKDKGFSLHITPLNSGAMIYNLLISSYNSAIFTSATLAVSNWREGPTFDHFREELGLSPNTKTLAIGSPFNYEDQMMLFIPPSDFPAPDSNNFIEAVLNCAVTIIKTFKGGVLFLCTSYKNMKAIADGLRRSIVDRRILVQGELSRSHTLDEFRLGKDSILVATGTFWEGIDVPGESLEVLLIDKLPFPSPGDPLVEGRSERLLLEGRDPFSEYFIPRMILALRQGMGRLIRSSKDRGVVGIFDSRIRTKNYGRQVLVNLPLCRIVEKIEDLTYPS